MKADTLRWVLGGICVALGYLFVQISLIQQNEAANIVINDGQNQKLSNIRQTIKELHYISLPSHESE